MKAKLIFGNSPEEEVGLRRCLKSLDMAIVLFEIQYNLKKQCERELEVLEADSDKWDGMEVVFRKLNELIEEYGIVINDLIK